MSNGDLNWIANFIWGIAAETYAICKADLLLKGEEEAADNIVVWPVPRPGPS